MLAITALDGLNATDPLYQYQTSLLLGSARTNQGALTGFTVVNKFLPGALPAGGANCRILVSAWTKQPLTINTLYIGNAATSGNAYDFDGNQVQATFNSSAILLLPAGGSAFTDNIAFTIDPALTTLVAMDVFAAGAAPRVTNRGKHFVAYRKGSVQQAGTTIKNTGYTASAGMCFITFEIDVSD